MRKPGSKKAKQLDPIPDSFSSIEEAADFWDEHSLADYWEQTQEVKDVRINLVRRHFRVDSQLARKINRIAQQRGISSETLVNLWLQEKVS
jgi:hypothetical protein